MDIERIILLFRRLSGLSEKDVISFRFMCEAAFSYVDSRLKSDINVSLCGGRLETAAAALAYYRYVLWCITDGELNQIKVGELSSKRNGSAEIDAAEKLCRQAFSDIADLLEHDGFVFSVID